MGNAIWVSSLFLRGRVRFLQWVTKLDTSSIPLCTSRINRGIDVALTSAMLMPVRLLSFRLLPEERTY